MSIKQVVLLAAVATLGSAGTAAAQVAPGSPSFQPPAGVASYPSVYTAPGLSYPSAFLPQSFGNNGMFSSTYRSPATPGIVGGASYPFSGSFFNGSSLGGSSLGGMSSGGSLVRPQPLVSSLGSNFGGVGLNNVRPIGFGTTGAYGIHVHPTGGMNSFNSAVLGGHHTPRR